MRRYIYFFFFLPISIMAFGQVKLPQVRMLESRGWSVQHSVMSWDSLTIFFAAKQSAEMSYDLYEMHADGWRWSEPQRINALSTGNDESWPSISSDERMLFYVTSSADGSSSQIWRAWNRNGEWSEASPLIISTTADIHPQILEDNSTLVFLRREQTKKNNGPWKPFVATMVDSHNWTLPQPVETSPQPQPIIAASGNIVMKKSGRPLSSGQVLVYDATDGQLLQTAAVHPMTGRWKVALQRDRHYRLALMAKGYSYHYIDINTNHLDSRQERSFGEIALENRLTLTLNAYDSETQEIINTRREILALGKRHTLPLKHDNYKDTLLEVNTARPMVFTETELDIPLQPKKSLHHFVPTHAVTGEPVPDVSMRLNGQPTRPDTALRINQEQTLQLSAPGFLFYDTLFNTGTDQRERTLYARLTPLTKDLVLRLRNIQFEYNSYELTESSNDELESLAQLLFINPSLRIELAAHTDDQGSDQYNDRLSSLRGKAVQTWLIERGVDPSRMEAVGYGKRKPLVANDSEANRAINRRVEIKVLDF